MTAQHSVLPRSDAADPLLHRARPARRGPRAHRRQRTAGVRRSGRVGLELEFHLVDLARPGAPPDVARRSRRWWPVCRAMPSGSRVTLEPGGQIELSTPPAADVVAAVAALQADREVLRAGLAAAGFGAAPLGADPARPVRAGQPERTLRRDGTALRRARLRRCRARR